MRSKWKYVLLFSTVILVMCGMIISVYKVLFPGCKNCPSDPKYIESDQDMEIIHFGYGGLLEIDVSPDGEEIAAATSNGVWIYDFHTLELKRSFGQEVDWVWSLDWSLDGKKIVTAGYDGILHVWDATSGDELLLLQGHTEDVNTVEWSPTGEKIASGGDDGSVYIWDGETGKHIQIIPDVDFYVKSIAWSPDGKQIVASGNHSYVTIFDVESGKNLYVYSGHNYTFDKIAWSPDGSTIASLSTGDRVLSVWDPNNGDDRVFEFPTDIMAQTDIGLVWSTDGKLLASSENEYILIYSLDEEGKLILSRRIRGSAHSLDFSPDGKKLVSGSEDGLIQVWDISSQKVSKPIVSTQRHTWGIYDVAWSPNGHQIASANGDNTVSIWDMETGEEQMVLKGHTDMVMLVAWSPNGNLLASMSNDDTFRIWDLETGEEKIIQHASCDYSRYIDDCKNSSIAWSPDGNALAFTDDNSEIKVWDIETEKVKISFENPTQEIIRFSWLNNEEIASIGSDRTIRIWNILQGEQMGLIGFDCKRRYSNTCYLHLYTVTWSSDNETLAFEEGYATPFGGSDGGIGIYRVWNIVDEEEKFEVWVPKAFNISISPDATKFAVGYFRSNIGIVDINNLNIVKVIGKHLGPYGITSIDWSPDGSKIASAGADGTIRIWGIPEEE